ncbi:hypothetical protein EDC32_102355 [Laceyella sacchari]|nr:hypothetical protein EDC32_102355 [Laceyella sacchari]
MCLLQMVVDVVSATLTHGHLRFLPFNGLISSVIEYQ